VTAAAMALRLSLRLSSEVRPGPEPSEVRPVPGPPPGTEPSEVRPVPPPGTEPSEPGTAIFDPNRHGHAQRNGQSVTAVKITLDTALQRLVPLTLLTNQRI
jgi:hypothetical protein